PPVGSLSASFSVVASFSFLSSGLCPLFHFLCPLIRPRRRSSLFPYTTLFRSHSRCDHYDFGVRGLHQPAIAVHSNLWFRAGSLGILRCLFHPHVASASHYVLAGQSYLMYAQVAG